MVFFKLKQSKNVKFNYTYKGIDTFPFCMSGCFVVKKSLSKRQDPGIQR
jgi:hypothetical protein